MKSSMFFADESTSSQMLIYGRTLLQKGEVYNPEEKLRRINEMKKEDVLKAIELIFNDEKKATSIVGNLDYIKAD